MQIVIPMNGAGTRFLEAGFPDPKPLIPIGGRPIIEYVLRLFPGETNFTFICHNEHLATTQMRAILEKIAPTGTILGVDIPRRGPVPALLEARGVLNPEEPTLVSYCDFFARWDYPLFKKQMEQSGADGAIPCYIGFHPHLLGPNRYAGCRVDAHNNLLEIREKYSFTENPMETFQSCGLYYFRSAALMFEYAEKQMAENVITNNEFYVSMMYNLLVRDGKRVAVTTVDQFCQWGTPLDLGEFLYWKKLFDQLLPQSQ